jgi:hypothetical protein
LRVAGDEARVKTLLSEIPGVLSIEAIREDGEVRQFIVKTAARPTLAAEIAAVLVGHGLGLSELTPITRNLEQIFLDLTNQARDQARDIAA